MLNGSLHFLYRQTPGHNRGGTGVNLDATGVNRNATGVNRDATGVNRCKTRGYTGLHCDDTVIEPGPRPVLHRGNTVTERTRSNSVETVPRFIMVYRLVFNGANRGRTGTVRTGLYIYSKMCCTLWVWTRISLLLIVSVVFMPP